MNDRFIALAMMTERMTPDEPSSAPAMISSSAAASRIHYRRRSKLLENTSIYGLAAKLQTMLPALQGAWLEMAIAFSGSIGARTIEQIFLKKQSTISHQVHNNPKMS